MKKEIITIAGKPGSGKSTTANRVAALLGYERFSSGDFIREVAKRRGVGIEELNHLAILDPAIDHEVDGELRAIGETKEKLVIDSRLAFHWIPDSFKIYLELDLQTAAERIFNRQDEGRKASGEVAETAEALRESIERRLAAEQQRYHTLYGINPHNTDQFDLVVDTTREGPDEVASQIVEAYRQWLAE